MTIGKTFTMHFLPESFTGAGYMVDSNKEHGEGRSDVVLYDSINGGWQF